MFIFYNILDLAADPTFSNQRLVYLGFIFYYMYDIKILIYACGKMSVRCAKTCSGNGRT